MKSLFTIMFCLVFGAYGLGVLGFFPDGPEKDLNVLKAPIMDKASTFGKIALKKTRTGGNNKNNNARSSSFTDHVAANNPNENVNADIASASESHRSGGYQLRAASGNERSHERYERPRRYIKSL